MARIRTIKPEFFQDKDLSHVSYEAAYLFSGMWCFANDCGVIDADMEYFKNSIFPYRHDAVFEKITTWLKELCDFDFIIPFKLKEKKYFLIRKFQEHQYINRPNKKEFEKFSNELINSIIKNYSLKKHKNSVSIPVALPDDYWNTPTPFREHSVNTPTPFREHSVNTPTPFCEYSGTGNGNQPPNSDGKGKERKGREGRKLINKEEINKEEKIFKVKEILNSFSPYNFQKRIDDIEIVKLLDYFELDEIKAVRQLLNDYPPDVEKYTSEYDTIRYQLERNYPYRCNGKPRYNKPADDSDEIISPEESERRKKNQEMLAKKLKKVMAEEKA